MEKKVLGKGLSALIPQEIKEKISSLEINNHNNQVITIQTSLIKNNPFQPRQDYDESKLEELKASIKEKGILQPILVRPVSNGYEVVAGERRLRAARSLHLNEVPVLIKTVTDQESLILALVENIQRAELNPIEEAKAFVRLTEEFHLTQEQVAETVSKDRTTVTNILRLLKLPKEIQQYIVDGKLSMGHARALLAVEEPALQKKFADQILDEGLSVRAIEGLVKQAPAIKDKKKKVIVKDRDVEILEEELRGLLGTKVSLEDKQGKGKIVVEYYSLDDLDRILALLRHS